MINQENESMWISSLSNVLIITINKLNNYLIGLQYYTHKDKGCKYQSIVQVRNYIFEGFDKLKMEVDQETNEVREVSSYIISLLVE